MLARVGRLEVGCRPSPIVAAYGSFEAFAVECDAAIGAGVLDPHDGPDIVAALARWERDGVWGEVVTRG